MDTMTKEESYADRRLLFKGIWETAMQFDEKDADNIMAKPKVIKTLRLDEVDKYVIGKRKKERIRNLRTVCKKILEFCNRQDVEDMLYEKREAQGIETDGEGQPNLKLGLNLKKVKTYRRKLKTKRTKSLFAPKKLRYQADATSEKNEDYPTILTNASRNNSPNGNKRTTYIAQSASVTHRMLTKVKSNPNPQVNNSPTIEIASTRRKVMRKKKRTKRKKSTTPNLNPPGPSGAPHPVRYVTQPKTGRMIVKTIKQFLTDNKIEVT